MFIPDKEVKFKIPHYEAVQKCPVKFTFVHFQHLFFSVTLNRGGINGHCGIVNCYVCMNFQAHVVLN